MATKLATIIADFRASLATEIAVGGTSGQLQSNADSDGVALPTGTYFFTIDGENSQKEHIVATNTAGVLSAISSVSRQGVQTSGVVRKHRIGATVTITDFAHIKYLNDLLRGTTDLNASVPLKYDGTATISNPNHLATKAYVDGVAVSGAPDADEVTKGIIELATSTETQAGTSTGATGARLVPPNSLVKATSAGAGSAGVIPAAGADGLIDQTFLDKARTWTGLQTFGANTIALITPPGMVVPFAGPSAPSGWLFCDGSAVSRTTYATLFGILAPSLGTFTVTLASPGIFTLVAHGLSTGDAVYLTTTGALPTGLSANTRYWVTKIDADTFKLATSLANALAATNINTSVSQSGVHTARLCPYGVGDGSTTFNLPSMKGLIPTGKDTAQTEFAGLGQTGGEKTHVLTVAELAAHTHTHRFVRNGGGGGSSTDYPGPASSGGVLNAINGVLSSNGSDSPHNNIQPYLTLNYIIKT